MSTTNGAHDVQNITDLNKDAVARNAAIGSQDSQTATDYINSQLQLEADAREALPYAFDACTQPLGPLKQPVFACLTCTPPPASPAQTFSPAGVCYSCSISCHGDHTLVEIFTKRNFVCDCGTARFINAAPCTLRADPVSGAKGVHSQPAADGNHYNQNFQNKFCGCGQEYDPHKQRGTMFQCLGLGNVESGGCGEDWWHPECVLGLPRDWATKDELLNDDQAKAEQLEDKKESGDNPIVDDDSDEAQVPPGFPAEDDFETFICYKCVDSNPWLKAYAGSEGFLAPVFKKPDQYDESLAEEQRIAGDAKPQAEGQEKAPEPLQEPSRKRKASEEPRDRSQSPSKKAKQDTSENKLSNGSQQVAPGLEKPRQKHENLPQRPNGSLSLFCKEDFRDHFCHCSACYPHLLPHPQLVEEEDTYEPPLSEDGQNDEAPRSAHSEGSRSLYDRGEAALNSMDRVRAIEGVMAYNHMRDKVKAFLKPYAETGKAVGAEDIKAYFEKLRGDEAAIREAGGRAGAPNGDSEGSGDNRREQSGY